MQQLFLYIDPGTGSMLFSIVIGLATAFVFGFRALIIKLKFVIGRGKQTEVDKKRLGIVIFTDDKRYWNIFGPICREAEARKIPLTYYTQSEDDPAFNEKFEVVHAEFIGKGNKGFAKMNFLNADIVLSTTPGLDVYQWKRSRNVSYYVFIVHAVDDVTSNKMFGLDYYDAVLLSGDYQGEHIRLIEKKRDLSEKELVTVGYPPMDEQKKRLEAITEAKNNAQTKKTILVAPSWGKSAILSRFGEEFLNAIKSTGYNIIIRPHPQTRTSEKDLLDSLMQKFPATENFEWNFDNDNFDCMNKADILITDFSGIIFDFAIIFDRPLIYADTSFDSGTYDACWVEEPMWKFRVLPEIGIKLDKNQFGDMKTVIENALSDEKLKTGREKVRKMAWQHQGESVKRIVDYLVEKTDEISSKTSTMTENL